MGHHGVRSDSFHVRGVHVDLAAPAVTALLILLRVVRVRNDGDAVVETTLGLRRDQTVATLDELLVREARDTGQGWDFSGLGYCRP